jgi:hypothetical protein
MLYLITPNVILDNNNNPPATPAAILIAFTSCNLGGSTTIGGDPGGTDP